MLGGVAQHARHPPGGDERRRPRPAPPRTELRPSGPGADNKAARGRAADRGAHGAGRARPRSIPVAPSEQRRQVLPAFEGEEDRVDAVHAQHRRDSLGAWRSLPGRRPGGRPDRLEVAGPRRAAGSCSRAALRGPCRCRTPALRHSGRRATSPSVRRRCLLAAAIQPSATIRLKPTIAVPSGHAPEAQAGSSRPSTARSATAPMVQKRVCWATSAEDDGDREAQSQNEGRGAWKFCFGH